MHIVSSERGSYVVGTSNETDYLLEASGVMKWKSTVESSDLLGATEIDRKELPHSHPTKRTISQALTFDYLELFN